MATQKKWISEQLCVSDASFTCNLFCKYCHNPPDGGRKKIKEILAEIKKSDIDSISLEGNGEPTTNPDLIELIEKARENGVKNIMLSTNAVNLSNKDLAFRLAELVDFITINFPSHIKEIYNSLTRSVKYEMAIKALDNLKESGKLYKARIFHIIVRENYKFLPELPIWLYKNYPDIGLLNFTFVRNKGRVKNNKEIVASYKEVFPYLKLALLKTKRMGKKAVIQNMPLCVLNGVEGFSFEYHRWLRGDKALESGIDAPGKIAACLKCNLRKGCCGARKDYLKIYGHSELKTSNLNLRDIKPERF
jgi:MoaA/NifB/PqqE/SkfB family radical SAM enzyme